MPHGMTGFASGEALFGDVRIGWRIKSVNHRSLDLSIRMPDGCESLELQVARRLRERFARGHLECQFTVGMDARAERRVELDEPLLKALLELERRVREHPDGAGREPLSLDRLLSWPGITRERRLVDELMTEAGQEAVLGVLDGVCQQLNRVRQDEGTALVGVMRRLLDELSARLNEVISALPGVRDSLEKRLHERVEAYVGSRAGMDEGLARELAYLFNRVDVAEEVDRLGVHLREMNTLLAGAQPVGLRLDFLCQELNREANTLCSKAQDRELSRLGVEIKVIVEQLREQARNLE
ncbi:MAG: YicC family protein [Magnetococcales bacterium]|nr:YicC family protein [Magnetococcales bacterium]